MSIVTLKKKTNATYKNVSTNQGIFSLNGTHRSQGYVGQTSLSRSLPRTLMNGNTPRGHGGCCGTYPTLTIVQSAVTSLNDPKVVKSSVMNTKGMLDEKLRCCKNIVKPDSNNLINNQSNYINNLAKQTIKQYDLSCNLHVNTTGSNCPNTIGCVNKDPFFYKGPAYVLHTKPESDYKSISQGDYLIKKHNKCVNNDIFNISNIMVNRTPLPGNSVSK